MHDRTKIPQAVEIISRDCEGDSTVDDHTRRITAPARAGAQSLVQVLRDLDDAGIAIDDIGLRRPTLDDVFLTLTGHAAELLEVEGNGAAAGEKKKRAKAMDS